MYWAIGNQTDQKPDDDNDVEDHVKADDGDGDGDDDGIINQTDQKPDDADGGDDLWKIRKNFNISFSCLFQADGGLLMLQIRDRNENISVGISASPKLLLKIKNTFKSAGECCWTQSI